MKYAGFVGPSYTLPNVIAAADMAMNWIPSKVESGTGPASYVYDPAPGYEIFCILPTTPTRGFFTLNGGTFAVGGTKLYEITIGGTAIERGTGLSNLSNFLAQIAGNGDGGFQLSIASDSTLYSFALLTNTLTTITTISATDTVFQDGYFIALDPSTSTFYLSALEDGTSWDLLDASQRNDSPDKWVKMLIRPKEIWLFGSQSTSVYYNAGDAANPFIPNPSVAIPYGTAAPASCALLNGAPAWLANDLTVRYANGYTPQRISTHAVEFAISQYATVSDADAFSYSEEGHIYYVLSFPTAQATWVYDLVSGLWHQRGTWNGLDFDVLPVWGYTFAFGKHLVGDRVSGNIYQMSQDFSTDTDGVSGIRRARRAPHVVADSLNRVVYDRFQLHMETGLGLASGQGSDPEVMLRWSNDGGQSFGNILTAKAGPVGDFRRRVIWRRLGQARDRVFEVSVSDPIPWRIVDAYLDVRGGAS